MNVRLCRYGIVGVRESMPTYATYLSIDLYDIFISSYLHATNHTYTHIIHMPNVYSVEVLLVPYASIKKLII